MKPPKIEITPKNVGDNENGIWSLGIESIKIDGKEISGVKSVDVHFDIEEFSTVRIEMVGEVYLDMINMIPNVTAPDQCEKRDIGNELHALAESSRKYDNQHKE